MIVFGIDTCCMAATCAIIDDDRMIAQTVINHKRTHSQKMMPQIESMFALAELDISDVDVFSAAVGPGSFTGVRIGVATVKAMAQATKKPCIAVSTLYALANNVMGFDGIVSPILDARRGQVYNSLFKREGNTLKRVCEDRAVVLESLLDELKQKDKPVMFLGDGTIPCKEFIIEKLGGRAYFAPKFLNMNLAGSVAEIAFNEYLFGNTVSYSELIPQYVRLSQAERERIMK